MKSFSRTSSKAIFTAFTVSMLVIGAGHSSHCWAQEEQQVFNRPKMIALKELDVIQQLNMHIEELTSVCGLGESQVEKLKVAAKNVAQIDVQHWIEEMDERKIFAPPKQGEQEEVVRIEDVDLDKLNKADIYQLTVPHKGPSAGPTHYEQWKQAVKSVLNDKQHEKLDAFRSVKGEKVLEATVKFFTEIHGTQLLLSDATRAELETLIRNHSKPSSSPRSPFGAADPDIVYGLGIGQEEFAKIFNEDQTIRWRIMTDHHSFRTPEENDDLPSRSKMVALKKLDVTQHLGMYIEELTNVCGIDEAQIKRLEIAAKGVAEGESRKWMDKLIRSRRREDMSKEKEVDRVKDVDLNQMSTTECGMLIWMYAQVSDGPTTYKIWEKTVKSVLNEEQQKRLNAFKKSRQQRILEATVEFVTEVYGTQLLLSEAKRAEFAKLLMKYSKPTSSPITKLKALDNLFKTISGIKREEFAEIFNETQMTRWRILKGSYDFIKPGKVIRFQANLNRR